MVKKKSGLSALMILVLIVGGLVIFGPMVGLGGVLEQAWTWVEDLGVGSTATGSFTWGIRPTSGSPSGSVLSGGSTYDSGEVTVYGAGKLRITGAQTCSASINYNIRVVQVGSVNAVSASMAFSGSVPMSNLGGGIYESGMIQFQKDYLTYADLGIPNVGDSKNLELYVSLTVIVDGTTHSVTSGSTSQGGKSAVDVEHTSDAAISFSWSNPPSLDWS